MQQSTDRLLDYEHTTAKYLQKKQVFSSQSNRVKTGESISAVHSPRTGNKKIEADSSIEQCDEDQFSIEADAPRPGIVTPLNLESLGNFERTELL